MSSLQPSKSDESVRLAAASAGADGVLLFSLKFSTYRNPVLVMSPLLGSFPTPQPPSTTSCVPVLYSWAQPRCVVVPHHSAFCCERLRRRHAPECTKCLLKRCAPGHLVESESDNNLQLRFSRAAYFPHAVGSLGCKSFVVD